MNVHLMGAVCWLLSLGWCLAGVTPITAIDADNKTAVLNEPGRISVLISSTQDTQKATRETGQILDQFQGMPNFREMVVVDLRESLGNLVPLVVRMEMRRNLEVEAKRIAPFFLANGSKENPRLYTRAIPDFSGKISVALGWIKPPKAVQVVVFGRTGEVEYRWTVGDDKAALQETVKNLLNRPLPTESADKAVP